MAVGVSLLDGVSAGGVTTSTQPEKETVAAINAPTSGGVAA